MLTLTNKEFLIIGERIKTLRVKQRISQLQFAELLDCSVQHLSRVENGARLSIDMLYFTALKLGCSIDELTGRFSMSESENERIRHLLQSRSEHDRRIALNLLETILKSYDQLD